MDDGDVGNAELHGESARGFEILVLVIAEHGGHGNVRQPPHGFQKVAARSRGNVEEPHRPPGGMGFFDRRLQQPFEMQLALADAAPADAVEIGAIDQPPQRRNALRTVFVNVVEGLAGIEAASPTQGDAAAQPANRLQHAALEGERKTAGLTQAVVFLFGVTGCIGVEEREALRGLLEALQNERAHAGHNLVAVRLVKDGVVEAGKDLHLLDGRREPVEELPLRGHAHDPVGAGCEQQRGHRDGAGVGQQTRRRVVQIEQDVDRYLPEDELVGLVALGLLGVVGEHARLDVALDVSGAENLLPQTQRGNGQGHIELHAKGRRGQDQGADGRRVIVHPGGRNHGADAMGQDNHVFRSDPVLGGDMAHEGVHVLDDAGEIGRGAALAGRAAVTALVPGEDRHVVQRQGLDSVLPAPRMLVATMKEKEGLVRRPLGNPGAVEELATIGQPHRLLRRHEARRDRDGSAVYLRHEATSCLSAEPTDGRAPGARACTASCSSWQI